MNFRFVINQLGLLLVVISGLLLAVGGGAAGMSGLHGYDPDWTAVVALTTSGVIGMFVGGAMWWFTRFVSKQLGRREALLLVGTSWIIGAALAALPYLFWAHWNDHVPSDHPFTNYADCYFEAMSGLTTTGATVLGMDEGRTTSHTIESMPRSLLFWRAMTHWVGGIGIVVLFVAVLPGVGVGGRKLYRAEATGVTKGGLQPHIRETARVLWYIYLGMTAVCIACLWLAGMNLFDSVCHSFSMVSTGGLSTRDASIGHYNSVAIDIVCIIFMLLAGVNFALFFQMTRRRFDLVWNDVELRVYLLLKVAVAAIVSINIINESIVTTAGLQIEPSAAQAVRFGAFQTVALHTGTGFCTADYDLWPFLSQAVLVGLMFIGGCAGSTAGGVKVIRIWIALKVMAGEIEKAFRPNVVRQIKVGGATLEPDLKLGAVVYVLAFLLMFGLGTVLIRLCEAPPEAGGKCDFLTAMSASLSTLSNVGPGLHEVGATKNYGWFTWESKCIMSMLMALGRLEVFAIIVMFSPRFWRGD